MRATKSGSHPASRFLILASFFMPTPAPVSAQFPEPASRPAQATSRPGEFQPGIVIDWPTRTARVEGVVVLAAGPIEFFAAFAGKEHESIVLLRASPTHVLMALGLLGLNPGHPPRWEAEHDRFVPATGDLIDVGVEWSAETGVRRAPAFDWIEEAAFARPALDRPFAFAGSQVRNRRVLAEETGAGVALVDMPDALLSLSRSMPDRNADLWAAARSEAIPPIGTPVTVLFRAAEKRSLSARVDPRGVVWLSAPPREPQLASVDDLAEKVRLSATMDASAIVEISLDAGVLHSDERRLRRELVLLGVREESVRITRGTTPHGR